jgi:transposase InsO family protein
MMLKEAYPLTEVCAVLDCSRSGVYYAPQGRDDEPTLREAIRRLAGAWPPYGYRRLTALLRREGWTVNAKRVRRLMRVMGLQVAVKRAKRRTTHSQHPYPRYPNLVQDLEVTFPDQVWVSDITYIRLRYEFVYLAVIMDVYTRAIRGWHLGRTLEQDLTLTALCRALTEHVPTIHHSDQGVQYAATAYTDLLKVHGVSISMAAVGAPEENPFAERLIRTIREEEVDLSEYLDYHDAYQHLGRFLEDVYMHKRIHSSLGYLTPAEFERQWLAQQATLEVVQ